MLMFNSNIKVIFLLLLVLSYIVNISVQEPLDLVPSLNSFEPKTLHITATAGGISHIAWTLEIGKVLAERGHNVVFLTTEPNLKFSKPYAPQVKTISMGPHVSKIEFRDLFDADNVFSKSVTDAYEQLIEDVYKRDFYFYKHEFAVSNTSLVICDQMSLPCFDAAKALSIPMVLHMTMSFSQDAKAPYITQFHTAGRGTTLNQTFYDRIYDRYVSLPRFIYRYYPVARAIKRIRQEIGIKSFNPLSRHSGVLKIINGFFGLDHARPVGPFVEYVGPIISTRYDPLHGHLSDFMQSHSRVVYVAFGQMYAPNTQEFRVLLTGLLEAYEHRYLDGIVWSLSTDVRKNLPRQLVTRSGRVYVMNELLDNVKYTDIRFEPWSPQFAILNHHHCKLFVSHGGASSIHESLFNGVPMLLHPFASDQPSNSYSLQDAGVALVLDRKKLNTTDTFEKVSTLLADTEGSFSTNMKTMQALVQIKSKRKHYAADLIEELLYTARNKNDIWHRREASAHMSWFKSTGWDIDLFVLACITAVVFLAKKIYTSLFNPRSGNLK